MIVYNHDHYNEIIPFAKTNFRNQFREFGIKTDDRRRHMYLIGKTGMGKTTMLENMIVSDIVNGHGVGLVDPHGDFAEKILDFIPSNRINDVIYFNPADINYPIAFNILETVDEAHKHLIASGLMGVFKKIWPDVWSARMEYILNNTILALLDYPGSTLLGINRMLADAGFRKKVIARITDPVIKAFWVNEFAKYNERYAQEAVGAIQNKVGQFLSAAIIRNSVGQVKSTIHMRDIMDSGKIFIMNLSKGRIGEDNSKLLGGMLITKLQLAAMERVDTPDEDDRRDFYLYVDEFQNFATESFANILSEARKYRLNLIMAHQYIEQLDELVAAAVFGNVGTLVSYRVGGADAESLVKEFTPRFVEEDLVNLTKFDIYLKLMIDGVASEPFSATTLPPVSVHEGHRETIIQVSRERYAAERSVIEEKIARWSDPTTERSTPDDDEMAPRDSRPPVVAPPRAVAPARPIREESPIQKAPDAFFAEDRTAVVRPPAAPSSSGSGGTVAFTKTGKKIKEFTVTCDRCAKTTTVPFNPANKPGQKIYCRECLAIVKGEALVITSPVTPVQSVATAQIKSEPSLPRPTAPVLNVPPVKKAPEVLRRPSLPPPPAIKLEDALKKGAVDFRGKKMPEPRKFIVETKGPVDIKPTPPKVPVGVNATTPRPEPAPQSVSVPAPVPVEDDSRFANITTEHVQQWLETAKARSVTQLAGEKAPIIEATLAMPGPALPPTSLQSVPEKPVTQRPLPPQPRTMRPGQSVKL